MSDKTCATCMHFGVMLDENGWQTDEAYCQLDGNEFLVHGGDTCGEWHNRDYTCDDCPWLECLAPMSCAGYRRWLYLDNPATGGPRAWEKRRSDARPAGV